MNTHELYEKLLEIEAKINALVKNQQWNLAGAPKQSDGFLSVEQLARRHKVAHKTAWRWVRTETILAEKHIKQKKKILIPMQAVLEWEEKTNKNKLER